MNYNHPNALITIHLNNYYAYLHPSVASYYKPYQQKKMSDCSDNLTFRKNR